MTGAGPRRGERAGPANAAAMTVDPLAGKLAPLALLVDVPRLVQRVAPAGDHAGDLPLSRAARHRWPPLSRHRHARAVGTHLCERARGPCGQRCRRDGAHNDDYTPTPAVSLAILRYNRGRSSGLADGIVVTPSHNPPDNGEFKYNLPSGGPAGEDVTGWIEACANARSALAAKRVPVRASCGATAASGRPTRTASFRRCCRRRSPPEPAATPPSATASWYARSASRCIRSLRRAMTAG